MCYSSLMALLNEVQPLQFPSLSHIPNLDTSDKDGDPAHLETMMKEKPCTKIESLRHQRKQIKMLSSNLIQGCTTLITHSSLLHLENRKQWSGLFKREQKQQTAWEQINPGGKGVVATVLLRCVWHWFRQSGRKHRMQPQGKGAHKGCREWAQRRRTDKARCGRLQKLSTMSERLRWREMECLSNMLARSCCSGGLMRTMMLKHFFKNLGTHIKPPPPLLHVKLISSMKQSSLIKALENGQIKMVSAMIEIVVDCISPYLIDCPCFMAQMYWICLNLLVLSEWYSLICHQP